MGVSTVLKEQLYIRQSGKCFWCGRDMAPLDVFPPNPLAATVDHVIPKAATRNFNTSFRAACNECNNLRSVFNPGSYQKEKEDRVETIRKQTEEIARLRKLAYDLQTELDRLTHRNWWQKFTNWRKNE